MRIQKATWYTNLHSLLPRKPQLINPYLKIKIPSINKHRGIQKNVRVKSHCCSDSSKN